MLVKCIPEFVFLRANFKLKASLGDADESADAYAGMASRAKHGRLIRSSGSGFEWLAEPDRPRVPRPRINRPPTADKNPSHTCDKASNSASFWFLQETANFGTMSIPLIDLSNPDIAQLAEQVKDACSVQSSTFRD
jgi:hypothetical protein